MSETEIKAKAAKITDTFVKAVRHKMVDLGWSDAYLCDQAGVLTTYWAKVIKGEESPSIDCVTRMTRAVGLTFTHRLTPRKTDVG